MNKQINIFGKEIPVDKVDKKIKSTGGRVPLKSQFRLMNGFIENFSCKNCEFFVEDELNKNHKCKKIGITKNNATSILKNDVACRLYEVNYNKEFR